MGMCYNEGVFLFVEVFCMKNKEVSIPLLAFTFFYSVAIYLLLLGFYFWHWHKQDKPVEQE